MDKEFLPAEARNLSPDEWEEVDTASAWIAFGSALSRDAWDYFLYPGASEWLSPPRARGILIRVSQGERSLDDFPSLEGHLLFNIETGIIEDSQNDTASEKVIGPLNVKLHIARAAEILVDMMQTTREKDKACHTAIISASREARRALAQGSLDAFGWRGPKPETNALAPREQIPAALFHRPITIKNGLIFPFIDKDFHYTRRGTELYSEVLVPGEQLELLWPTSSASDLHKKPADEEPSVIRASRAGRRPHKHRDAFIREMMRRADLDSLPDDKANLVREMREWAESAFGSECPGDQTMRDWVEQLFWRSHPSMGPGYTPV